MKCWYIFGENCDRSPGICEGCQKYEDWRKERERMMSPIGTNPFKVGERYFDAIGRKWEVRQIFKVNGWLCLMLSEWTPTTLFGLTNEWHPAIVEDGDKTATILLDEGFSTLYAEGEKE